MHNVLTVKHKGETYHFVTRGKSRPFSKEEADAYLASLEKPVKPFRVEGELRKVFSQDLRSGLEFCSRKYGVSEQAIWDEAVRLFPGQNMDRIVGGKREVERP